MKLLVVDDDPFVLGTLADAMEHFGHTVDRASDGADAVDLQLNNRYDVVITDAEMPRLDGARLCTFIKTNFPHVRIVGISGSYKLKELENAGADICLSKPFSLGTLRKAVEDRMHPSLMTIDRRGSENTKEANPE
jgi:two-component system, OmpR family, response regulator MprA